MLRSRNKKESTRLRGGGKKKKPQKKKEPAPPTPQYLIIDDVPLSKDAKHLGFIVPDDNERPEIERLMNVTYDERRALVVNPSCPTTLLLQAFKHLKSFEGRMIDLEFEKMFGQEKSHLFIRNFQDLIPLLYKVAQQDSKKYNPETCFMFGDSVLNSIMILSKYLPLPKRVYPWEEKMDIVPVVDFFLEVVPVGSSLKEKIELKGPVPIALSSHTFWLQAPARR